MNKHIVFGGGGGKKSFFFWFVFFFYGLCVWNCVGKLGVCVWCVFVGLWCVVCVCV